MSINRQDIYTSTQVLQENAVLAALEQSLAMIEFKIDGEVLWANEHFAHAMGYQVHELPGMHHRQFCLPDFATSSKYAILWENLRNGVKFQEKIIRVGKNGQFLWLEATYMPIYNDDKHVVAVLKIATDITARETAATQVTKELQQMAENLLKRTDEGIQRSQQVASTIENVVHDNENNLGSLQDLEQQAKIIHGIVQTIRDFASQTNLLALNATIEAAHAGEHGRGFNVVATEVRKLAQNVQEAIKQIQTTVTAISEQVARVSSGTKTSQKAVIHSQLQIQQAVNEFTLIGQAASNLDAQAKILNQLI
ncbi:PAS domain-containing methyl-accepting chemotaxis protein [Paenibacillus alba]|uniref:methyl-accepting chemotaxis protein n=1 Tax=Paenibacillus alba TaxID=1197127 RepID=UPI001565682C|nr:methyl-accepting chemotaxis protein [Paenibacillus alba]NQX71636.1 PAS domain-containing methyl-accepting chemotaxis protein [Paenibacillus alba]